MAISGKSAGSRNRKNKRIPLPPPAASCVGKYTVSRVSAVGCHPLRKVPSLRMEGVDLSCYGARYLLLLQSGHGH